MFLVLQIILALGNYMNSSKRGAVYGFKLQSLDLVKKKKKRNRIFRRFKSSHYFFYTICLFLFSQLLDTKSTDRKLTLLHYIANVVKEKYTQVSLFYNELHYVEKAAAGESQRRLFTGILLSTCAILAFSPTYYYTSVEFRGLV